MARSGLSTPAGAPAHVASRLIGAATRASREMGCRTVVSYTRDDEPGVCYKASGYVPTAFVEPEAWDRRARSTARPWLPGTFVPGSAVVARIRWEFPPGRVPAAPLAWAWDQMGGGLLARRWIGLAPGSIRSHNVLGDERA